MPHGALSGGDQERVTAAGGTTRLIERAAILLLFGGLLIGVVAVLRPFATAIMFGTILAVAAWPMRDLLLRCGLGRRLTAMLLFSLALATIALPVVALGPGLAEHLVQATHRLRSYLASDPQIPRGLSGLPLVGTRLTSVWEEARRAEGGFATLLEPYAVTVQQALIDAAQALATSVLQVILSLVIAAMFWVSGDAQALVLRDILRRLGGKAAAATLDVAAGAIRGVAMASWALPRSRLSLWQSASL